jgi:hypothetical protein
MNKPWDARRLLGEPTYIEVRRRHVACRMSLADALERLGQLRAETLSGRRVG